MRSERHQILRGGQSVDLNTIALARIAVPAEQVILGDPTAGSLLIDAPGRSRIGVWEITPGLVSDVEVDEVFVVISGIGLLEIDGGSVMSLRPGVLVVLTEGMRTRWNIEHTVRTLSLTAAPSIATELRRPS